MFRPVSTCRSGQVFFLCLHIVFFMSVRDVRHLCLGWRTSLPDTEPIIVRDRADLSAGCKTV